MSKSSQIINTAALVGAGVLLFAFILWGIPQLNVYNRTQAGRAALMEAESTRQVKVLEAQAKQDAASREAQAEVTRAEGSAKAISKLKTELGSADAYLRWLYIQGLADQGGQGEKVVVYVPTENLVPLPPGESTRLSSLAPKK